MKRIFVLIFLLSSMSCWATVTSQNFTVSYTCTGTTGPYAFTFPISDPTALNVNQNGIVLSSSSYTSTPVNNNYANGGSVTLSLACPNGQTLVISRITPLTQANVFTDNMPVPMKTFERSLDKLTEITQEQSHPGCKTDGANGFDCSGSIVAGGSITGASLNSTSPLCNAANPYLQYNGICGTGAVVPVNLTSKIQNQVVIAEQFASLNAAIAACPLYPSCTVQIDEQVSLSANLVVPSTVDLTFNQPGAVNLLSYTLTINGSVLAHPYKIFYGANGTNLTYGEMIWRPFAEWLGAAGDWNGTVGTDNIGSFNYTLQALTSGCMQLLPLTYMVSGTITVNKDNTGICGSGGGYGYQAGVQAGVSIIESTSASVDIVDVVGNPGTSTYLKWPVLRDFAVQRNVLPTGTTAGISLNYTCGAILDGTTSQDSIRDYYFHASPACGSGHFNYNSAGWGFLNVTAYTGLSVTGFYVDSADGVEMASPTFFRNSSSNNLTSTSYTQTGMFVDGSAILDLESDGLQTANNSIGINVTCTNPGINNQCDDLHFRNSTLDGITLAGIALNNVVVDTKGTVDFVGGWISVGRGSNGHGVDIENSSGIRIANMQITGVCCVNSDGILAQNSDTLTLIGNTILDNGNNGIHLVGVFGSTISSNTILNNRMNMNNAVWIEGASHADTVIGNTVSVNNATITYGFNLGASTTELQFCSNTAAAGSGGTISTAVTDAGTSNGCTFGWGNSVTTLSTIDGSWKTHQIGANGTQYKIRQVVPISSGCTATGGIGNSCSFTVTFPKAMPDTSYNASCMVYVATGSGFFGGKSSPSTSGFTLNFINVTASSNTVSTGICEVFE